MTSVIYELPQSRFSLAQRLYSGMWYDEAFIEAVFEGRQAGRIFVDDPDRPAAALMCHVYEFYVAGDPGCEAMRRFVKDAPEEPGAFQLLYGYVTSSADWDRAILDDREGELLVVGRRGFKYDAGAAGLEQVGAVLPPDYEIQAIDAALAERIDRERGEHIGLFWGGYDKFEEGGFGYCAIFGDEIASVAYAAAVSSRYANVSVETAPAHRRKGLSTATSAAFIRHCSDLGILATWDTDEGNAASIALAQKLGFIEYPPFRELSPPRGTKLALSSGRWESVGEAQEDGVTAWRRVGNE